MIKLAISGCRGRMGERIYHLAKDDAELKVACLLENKNHPDIGTSLDSMKVSDNLQNLKGCDVLIEFTTPEATIHHLEFCQKLGVKIVIGTTGLTAGQVKKIEGASRKLPIVFSSNMSVGVNLFFRLIKDAAKMIPAHYQMKIVEAHHIHKKDAPSGTAKTAAKIVEGVSRRKVADIQSLRDGEIVGDHDLIFESPEDSITIRHHAKTRDIFAKGALVAAKFLANKDKGLFTMQDVLNLAEDK